MEVPAEVALVVTATPNLQEQILRITKTRSATTPQPLTVQVRAEQIYGPAIGG